MDKEQLSQKAENVGWIVRDIRAKGMDVDVPWKHWEAVNPKTGSIFRAFTEDEAWEHVYAHLMNDTPPT